MRRAKEPANNAFFTFDWADFGLRRDRETVRIYTREMAQAGAAMFDLSAQSYKIATLDRLSSRCPRDGTKREAGENPAQGRCCIRSEVRVFFATATLALEALVAGRQLELRYQP